MASVIVRYGDREQYAVQFKIGASGLLWGRYLADEAFDSQDVLAHAGDWEHRPAKRDNAHVIDAIRRVLDSY